MPGDVGSKWELLLAFENALNSNYEQFRTAENTHLASVFGVVADGGEQDLFIPEGAVFSIVQDPTKLVDPEDCPVGYLALLSNKQGAMGPVSAAGEATVSLSLYLYVTDRIASIGEITIALANSSIRPEFEISWPGQRWNGNSHDTVPTGTYTISELVAALAAGLNSAEETEQLAAGADPGEWGIWTVEVSGGFVTITRTHHPGFEVGLADDFVGFSIDEELADGVGIEKAAVAGVVNLELADAELSWSGDDLTITGAAQVASTGTYNLTERELVIMSQAFEQAVISAVRFQGPNSVWAAGAGIKGPDVSNSLSRSYDVDSDGDSVTAIQIQQTWTMVQTVRY